MPGAPRTISLVWLFVFALSLRFGYFAAVENGPLGNPDSPAYLDLAGKITRGQPYQSDRGGGPGFPTGLQRPPGYPAFLAFSGIVTKSLAGASELTPANASGTSRRSFAIAQCILGAMFAVLLAALTEIFAGPRIGLWAGLFYAADWVTIVHTPMIIAETVYSGLLGLAVLVFAVALMRRQLAWMAAAGISLGVAALIKPAAEILLLAFFAAWLSQNVFTGRPFSRARWTAGAFIFLLAFLACIVPWIARNDRKYGVATLSTIGTADLYFYTAKGSLRSYPMNDIGGTIISNDVNRLALEWESLPVPVAERVRRMQHETVQLVMQHWPRVLEQAAIGFVRTCAGTGFVTAGEQMNPPPGKIAHALLAILPAIQLTLLWVFAIGGALDPRLDRTLRILLIGSIFCILLPAASPLAQSRFRVPAVPEMSVLAAFGVTRLWNRP